jgi:hypothetical protein
MRLVTLGDSITCGNVPWPSLIPIDYLHNAGTSGNTTAQMLARIAGDVTSYSPTDVTILGGVNDIYSGVPQATILARLGSIIEAVKPATPWLLTLTPYSANVAAAIALNAALPALAAAHGANLIDVWTPLQQNGDWLPGLTLDGTHPTAAGAQIIADTVAAAIPNLYSGNGYDIAPPLLHGWVNYQSSFGDAGYRKDPSGKVSLTGLIRSGTVNAAAFILPPGYRPGALLPFVTMGQIVTRVDVAPNGEVRPSNPCNNGWVVLNGISFYAVD